MSLTEQLTIGDESSQQREEVSIAIAHDQFRTLGGAERVAIELARTFDAPIYTMRVEEGVLPEDVTVHNLAGVRGTWLMRRHYLLQDAYQMLAWQHQPPLYEYDTIIQNKTNPYWFVPKDTQTVVRYCHSTPRGLYDQFRRQGGGFLSAALKTPQRTLYQQVVPYADAWAANSDLVARRMEKYFGLNPASIQTIYPPVETDAFSPDDTPTEDFYLCLSRLRGHKRIGDVIRAINQLNRSGETYRLVVAGEGPERGALEELAGPHVEFVGYVDEAKKRRLMSGAKALIFAAENEDFGMVPIESMAAGTPVIGVNEGFTKHQIQDGKNGIGFPMQGGHLRETIRHFDREGVEWSDDEIAAYAEHFSVGRFREKMKSLVARAQQRSTVVPAFLSGGTPDTDIPAIADGSGT